MENLKSLPTKQQGVVLITALIMVIAVTGIAVTLMSSSTIDIKITNAAQEREVAENQLIGEVLRVIASEAKKGAGSNFFLTRDETKTDTGKFDSDGKKKYKFEKDITEAGNDMKSIMTNMNHGSLELNCPRSYSYTAGVSCNMVQVSTTIEYGSKSKHQLTIVTGIAQEMASTGKGI
ncbi:MULTISPECIES: pilus assembly PilX family protein [Pseudoalteromonas]|uniref:pilus assembly PilX family protein n=1 Tax=Pseudoalteromonas TaxID=53246 RepID=UPI000849A45A|nr:MULTISPECIES: pilus assembly protein PilX [Pseudoalteromonas]MCK8134042.1 pilus assembly protein PilX [Pseudoalteromonas sp. 2CM28B]ODS12872.1 pilus assembly protein PilX [Pseudoalteromonas tetraodonis]